MNETSTGQLRALDVMQFRLGRIRRMTLRELANRGKHESTKWLDRVVPGRSPRTPAELFARHAPSLGHSGAPLALLREHLPQRFFAGVQGGSASEWLATHLPAHRLEILDRANQAGLRRLDLLGYQDLAFSERIDWHRDVVSGVRAPQIHWSQLAPLDPRTIGDSKVTWELNRHQWLVTLAQAYAFTDDVRYAQEAADLLQDWMQANPYGVGINWASSLEVGYRLIAWCWVLVLLRDAGVFSDEACAQLLAQLWLHATHVERYLSYYFSPNTHLTGEALALFYAGVLFPEFSDATRWRDVGARILIDESRRQILADGVHFEQATCYQRYTIEIYTHFLLLAERSNVSVPADVKHRVEGLLEALSALTRPDGTMPQIGDADGGWLLPLAAREPGDCRAVFALGAVMFGRSDFKAAAGGPTPEVAWMLGPAGVARFDQLRDSGPAISTSPSRLLAAGGYAVMRSDATSEAHQLIMDVGPLGCPISGAHGHADLLSLQCQAFGESYLVDPGTYCYTADAAWRDHFRGTSAHSTVVVDGRSQAVPHGPFAWRRKPAARVRTWRSTEVDDFIDAEHDAYDDLPEPVRHRRRVLFVRRQYWVVVDDLIGRGEHRVDLRFQFGVRPVRLGPASWASATGSRGRGLWIAPFATVPVSASLRQGEMQPIDGWISTHYGRRQPAPAVVYSTTSRLPLRIVTVLLPVEQMDTMPPAANVTWHPDGSAVLRVGERDAVVEIDDDRLVEQSDVAVRR